MSLNSISSPILSSIYMDVPKEDPKMVVTIDLQPNPISPAAVVDFIALIGGELDVYTWYEGPTLLTKKGAQFLKKNLFDPLYQRKRDAKLLLYSLEAWNFQKNVNSMNETTPNGVRINSINKVFIECVYASSFFKFCTQSNRDTPLYRFVNKLPEKPWLVALSATRKTLNKTVDEFFEQQPTLVDCIKTWDLSKSYSILQYLEAYFLIREALIKGIEQDKQKIQVAFVLPNDEAKYYKDLPDEIELMLEAEFGGKLNGIELNIYFRFYEYGKINSRPYLGAMKGMLNVRESEIESYFSYITDKRGS